ncbi:MAG: hypothetical protein QOG44_96 [Acidimicrobiaceae bacterium]|nr:hypothetical protein [Acidimicrobiaceae bacterium]
MPRFEPFSGIRYNPAHVSLADVVAPPYDVISPDERASLQAQSPYNSVRIELPDEDDEDPDLDRYQSAARRMARWQAEGVLRRDPTPSFYGYRMSYSDESGAPRHTIGVIGALGLEPPGTAGIFPHERTTPKAKSDRLQLLQATQINTSPIWGLSLATGLSEALEGFKELETLETLETSEASEASEALETSTPASLVVDADGIEHALWPITDPASIAWLTEAVSGAPIVIADGHHRFETALTYQAKRHSESAGSPRPYDAVMALIVELAEPQLSVQAIHRLITGLPEPFDLVGALARHFVLAPIEADASATGLLERMVEADSLAVITTSGTWLLHPKPETTLAATHDLDSSRLEVALATLPAHEVTYQHGLDLARGAVERGEAQAAVLLRPVTVEQIASTGRGGERMPPKTTFFWPKPRTGFVFREVTG